MVTASSPRRWRALVSSMAAAVSAAQLAWAAPPLGLDEALRLAESNSPQLAAQRSAAAAAAALVGPSGENPDPKLFFGIENVPTDGGDRWNITSDFMTMRRVGVMQEMVRGEKRELREARANAESLREAAVLELQRAELRRDVAAVWFERAYAERARTAIEALAEEAKIQSSTAAAELSAGKATTPEAIAARAMLATLADRQLEVERQARRAAAMLGRWIGGEADRAPGPPPDIFALGHHAGGLEANLTSHPHLAMFAPMEAAAEADLRLAAAATKPDWSVELSYAQRGPAFSNMVSVMVRMELPIFGSRRQDPVTESKGRKLEQVRAEFEEATRRHTADIRAGVVDWEFAKARLDRQRSEIVPLAEERSRAALAAYAGSRAGLAEVLEARRNVLESKLAAIGAEAEVARAWAQLAFIVPESGRSP